MSNGSDKRTPINSGGDGARIPVAIGGGEGGEEWARDLKAEREEYDAAVQDLEFALARAKRGFFSRLGHTVENGFAAAVNWMADGASSPANAPGPGDKTYERTSYLDTALGAAGGPVFGKVVGKIASKVGNALGREAADSAATTVFKQVDEVVDEVDHAGARGGEPVPDPRQVEIAEEFASRAHHGDVPEPRNHGDAPHGAENLDEPGRIDELDPGLDPTWDPEGPWNFPAQRRGEWAGTRGDSDWTPHDPGAYGLERGESIPFREGVPDLSSWAVQTPSGQRGLLEVPGLSGGKGDTDLVIEQLAKQEGMSEPAVKQWLADNDLRIHHFGGNEVQIVRERLHGALHHQGGSSELRAHTLVITPLAAGHQDDAPPPQVAPSPPLAPRLLAALTKLGIDLPIAPRTASDDRDDGTEPPPARTDPPPAVPARDAPPPPPPQPPGGAQMSYLDDDVESAEMSYRESEDDDEQSSRQDDGEGEGQTRPREEREEEERGEEQMSYLDDGEREEPVEEQMSYLDDGEGEADGEEQVSYPEDEGGQEDGDDGAAAAAAGP